MQINPRRRIWFKLLSVVFIFAGKVSTCFWMFFSHWKLAYLFSKTLFDNRPSHDKNRPTEFCFLKHRNKYFTDTLMTACGCKRNTHLTNTSARICMFYQLFEGRNREVWWFISSWLCLWYLYSVCVNLIPRCG